MPSGQEWLGMTDAEWSAHKSDWAERMAAGMSHKNWLAYCKRHPLSRWQRVWDWIRSKN